MLAVARDNVALSEYLIGQVLQTSAHQFAMLQQFFPTIKRPTGSRQSPASVFRSSSPTRNKRECLSSARSWWQLRTARRCVARASTAAFIAIGVLQKRFPDELTESAWLPKLKQIIPTYGIDLTRDADACRRIRAEIAPVLKVENV
jgi:malate dehydrogenase (quinone)